MNETYLMIGIIVFLVIVVLILLVNQSKNNEMMKQILEQKDEVSESSKELVDIERANSLKLEEKVKSLQNTIHIKDNNLVSFKNLNMNLDNKFNRLNPMIEFLNNFRDVKKNGYIGEFILENLLDGYGFLYSNSGDVGTYTTQKEIEKGKKPDVIINITNETFIVIDSKSLILDYDNLNSIKNLDNLLLKQMENLQSKEYHYMNKSLDFVIMFVPFDDILKHINISSFNKNVILATPSTLQPILSLLKNLLKEQKYTNFNLLEKELLKVYNTLVDSLNAFSNIRNGIKKLDKDIDKLYNTLEEIEDIHKTFDTFKNMASLESKKKLKKEI